MKKLGTFILVAFLAVVGIKVYGSFSRSIWDGKSRLNLVLANEKVSIFSLDPLERTAVFLSIPPQTFIDVIHGYDLYRVETIYKLGQLENHKGGELLAESLQENLGIPIDAYASISNFKFQISNFKAYILECFKFLLGNGQTNLTKWDLLRLWWETRRVRQDKIAVVDLQEEAVLKEIVFADGSKGFEIEKEKMEKIAQKIFKDQKLRQEDLPIAILNSTSHSGLAERGARIIKNIGGRVVQIGNTENSKLPALPAGRQNSNSKCEVRSKKTHQKSYTVKKLVKIFNCRWGGEDLADYRAEVVLILAEDYWKKLEEKW